MIPIFLFFYHGEGVVWCGFLCRDGVFVAIFMWDKRWIFEAKCAKCLLTWQERIFVPRNEQR